MTDDAGFFQVYEGAPQNGQSTQNSERAGDSGIASAGLARAASVGRGLPLSPLHLLMRWEMNKMAMQLMRTTIYGWQAGCRCCCPR